MCDKILSIKKIKVFSFFSGSGFLDFGFEKAGFPIESVNELSKSFLAAYKFSREKMNMVIPKYYFENDINDFLAEKKKKLQNAITTARGDGSLIFFIGGPPCPDFSVGGKNKGKDGENGKLSLSYISLIIEMQPDLFLFENVKGLSQTNEHRKFYNTLKTELHTAGYCTTDRLTNALEFGVSQDRDRIFMLGIKKAKLTDSHFDENNCILDFQWTKYATYTTDEVKKAQWPRCDIFNEDATTECPINDKYKKLTIQYWFDKNDVENHPNARLYFKPRSGLKKFETIQEGDVGKKSYKRLHRWRYSPTAAYGNNEVHLHPYKKRRISVAEALAIQSLPKEFQLPKNMSLSDMFKTIGNGVPFLLSLGIVKAIKDYLGESIK